MSASGLDEAADRLTAADSAVLGDADDRVGVDADESPEKLPPKAWVTLVGFALFVIAFGTCASTFMFN